MKGFIRKFAFVYPFILVALIVILQAIPSTVVKPHTQQHTSKTAVTTHTINMVNFAFDPPNLTINQGDTVTWINKDKAQHTTTSNDGDWDSGLLSQNQSFSFIFNNPGIYDYHCIPHQGDGMIASITVSAASTNPPPPADSSLDADIDRNGCVGILDFNAWFQAFANKTTRNATFPDVNKDGSVDLLDFNQWFKAMTTLPKEKLC